VHNYDRSSILILHIRGRGCSTRWTVSCCRRSVTAFIFVSTTSRRRISSIGVTPMSRPGEDRPWTRGRGSRVIVCSKLSRDRIICIFFALDNPVNLHEISNSLWTSSSLKKENTKTVPSVESQQKTCSNLDNKTTHFHNDPCFINIFGLHSHTLVRSHLTPWTTEQVRF
jgi:hypothetical protein